MTVSIENYLKALFILHRIQRGAIKTNLIASRLNVSSASVTEMIKKLSSKKLVKYSPYQGVELTKTGIERGRNMVRRHRILELFLHEILGIAWNKVHQEAEKLEHATSDMVINKMEEVLHFPKYDPHGDPIPALDGTMPELKGTDYLNTMQVGDEVELMRVVDDNDEFLSFLESVGIRLGVRLIVIDSLAFDHSMKVKVEGKEQILSAYITKQLWVNLVNRKEQ